MYDVVSLGSVNVDHVGYLADDAIAALERRYDWLPEPGETVAVSSVPETLRDRLTETSLGGKGANQAVAAARAGADAAFLGAVGADDARYGVRAGVRAHGVDVSGVARVDGPTGSAYIVVDDDGENRIAILAGANAAVDRDYVREHAESVHDADCLLLQNEIPTDGVRWLLDRLAETPDGPTVVLNPAPVAGAEPLVRHDAVDVVDTTGAGDVFTGYLAATLSTGGALRTAVERGVVAAALSTETEGVQPAVPDAATVDGRL
jgi:ribokinase